MASSELQGPDEFFTATVFLYQRSPISLDAERFMAAVRIAVGPDREAVFVPEQREDSERMLLFAARVQRLIYAFSYRGPLLANASAGPNLPPELAVRVNEHVDALILEIFDADEVWATRAVTRLAGELAGDDTMFLWNYNRERLVEVTPAAREVLRSECPEDVYRDAVDAPPYRGDEE